MADNELNIITSDANSVEVNSESNSIIITNESNKSLKNALNKAL